jgi:beta-alanine--pyruvate transaminase
VLATATDPASRLAAYWMPFTPNRRFKRDPRLLAEARGMHYTTVDGRRILDGIAGLWCVNAGHSHPAIAAALKAQIDRLDFASSFAISHPGAFVLAERLAAYAPGDLNHVFFTNSGSESVDTALKIALAYHRARGDGGRFRLVGRERAYHGVNFGGISVGGIGKHRAAYGPLLPGAIHLPHTHDPQRNPYARGQPQHGGIERANALESLIALHDASTIAAVIVEPVAGSTGVLPPPAGYLQRLREICDRHGILLIFDEVITGFGRLGARFAAERFGVLPDLMTAAKGITNAAVPMGAVFVRDHVHAAFMHGSEDAVELPHGYTNSGHPLACAAALATLDVHEREALPQRAADSAAALEAAAHGLRGLPGVTDIRNVGMLAAFELEPWPGGGGRHAQAVAAHAFEHGVLVRPVGETIVLSPPLVIERTQIDELVQTVADALRAVRP